MTNGLTRRRLLQISAATVPAFAIQAPWRALASEPNAEVLLEDDFSKMPARWLTKPFPTQGPAIQENQWVTSRAYPFGKWFNGTPDQDAWMVSAESDTGHSYMEMMLTHPPHGVYPVLISGEPEWKDYTYEALVRPLAFDGNCGVAFRYKTNRDYSLFSLQGGDTAQLRLQNPFSTKFRDTDWEVLASAPFPYTTERYYALKVENEGTSIRCYIDGKLVVHTDNVTRAAGKVGLSSNIPVRFQNVRVQTSASTKREIVSGIEKRVGEERKLQATNPKPKVLSKFSVKGFGCASNARFGDLDGDGLPEMLLVQNIQTISRDAFDGTSCITAVKLDGTVMWQQGRPDPENGWLTNDTPIQIHDVDGDGMNEVVCIRDFQIQILDGKTGRIKKKTWTPKAPKLPTDLPIKGQVPYERLFGDSLFFVNVSGNKDRHEILIKDRYWNFWIYNNDLELLWHGEGQTGHAPYVFDVNGYDHIAIGYAMWDHTGKQLWTHDRDLHDHADAVAVTNATDDPKNPMRCYYVGSDEGFIIIDIDGKLLKHTMIGHAQNMSIGKYRMDLPGRQVATIDFHTNVGIMFLFDADGNILENVEMIHNGSKLLPVNWHGDGQEMILLSADPNYGGMVDGHFRRAVMFPDDGHPVLAYWVIDTNGDGLDEVVTWDDNAVWVYGPDQPAQAGRVYAPTRNPLYNWSNYMSRVSTPGWHTK